MQDKNREISPLEREEGYGGKGSAEKVSFKTRMEDPVRHANHHFQGQKVNGQLAGGRGILWRPPTQIVYYTICRSLR